MPAQTFRITAMTDVTVMKEDSLTGQQVAVALNEDLSPQTMIRVLLNPGASTGTAALRRRVSGVNSSPKTIKPNHPFTVNVSALFGWISQTAVPYLRTGSSP